jgi:hypothetical protein
MSYDQSSNIICMRNNMKIEKNSEYCEDIDMILEYTYVTKEDDEIDRYAQFLDEEGCKQLNGTTFREKKHVYYFDDINKEFKMILNPNYDENEDENEDDYEDFETFTFNKYRIENQDGYFWLMYDIFFWTYNDPEESKHLLYEPNRV